MVSVSCPTTPDLTVVTVDNSDGSHAYSPATSTINAGQIVKFVMTPIHDAQSGTPGSPDTTFHVDFNQTRCLQFTEAGTFPFYCSLHLFTGTITVQ